MPSREHEALVELFRHSPSFVAELLVDALGLAVPDHQQARVEPAELTDFAPTEYRADAVVVLSTADKPQLAVVVEAQLNRDQDKRWTWPVYLATLRARLRCPTVLLVVCVKTAMARWCATPIELGHPGWSLSPLVIGPDRVPLITDTEDAIRTPALAVLSALAHASHPDRSTLWRAPSRPSRATASRAAQGGTASTGGTHEIRNVRVPERLRASLCLPRPGRRQG